MLQRRRQRPLMAALSALSIFKYRSERTNEYLWMGRRNTRSARPHPQSIIVSINQSNIQSASRAWVCWCVCADVCTSMYADTAIDAIRFTACHLNNFYTSSFRSTNHDSLTLCLDDIKLSIQTLLGLQGRQERILGLLAFIVFISKERFVRYLKTWLRYVVWLSEP